MRDFRQLKVWEKAHSLALRVYHATSAFPREERYGLTSQVRRCVASIPANIAEGCGADTTPEFGRYLQIAMKSVSELDYHLLLARDLKMLPDEEYEYLRKALLEVQKMLASLIRSLRSTSSVELTNEIPVLVAND